MIRSEEIVFEDHYDEDILNLICLSNCIDSLIGTKELKMRGALDEITEIRASIDCAIELLSEYDKATDENMKHEFGFQYSELIADIGDQLEEINSLGINLYIH